MQTKCRHEFARKQLQTFPGFALAILLCLSAFLSGCDDGNPPVVPTATLAPTARAAPSAQPINTKLHNNAVQVLMQAATVAANLRSYRYVLNDGVVPDVTVGDVVAPDRCRAVYNQNGSTIETIHIGRYFYAQQPGTDEYIEYYNDRFDSVTCPGDFMPSLGEAVSQLAEANIVGDEYLDGHKVVHIRYTLSPPDVPFPTGSASTNIPETEVWIEKETARLLKLLPSIYEPTTFFVYSRFDEPVMPPIEKPAKLAPATFTPPPPVPTSSPAFP